jgi:hypothetical protein
MRLVTRPPVCQKIGQPVQQNVGLGLSELSQLVQVLQGSPVRLSETAGNMAPLGVPLNEQISVQDVIKLIDGLNVQDLIKETGHIRDIEQAAESIDIVRPGSAVLQGGIDWAKTKNVVKNTVKQGIGLIF